MAPMAALMSTFAFTTYGYAPTPVGVPGSNDAPTAKRWVKATNIYRCMNGQREVGWSQEAADDAQTYLNNLAILPATTRANPYCLLPPAGPAGENYATGSRTLEDAVGKWYGESNNCIGNTGCSAGINGTYTRHFTALVWMGVTQIGCAVRNSSYICRYRSGDTLGPQTANMLGAFKLSVKPQTKTFAQCKATASGTLYPTLLDPTSLYPNVQQAGDAMGRIWCPGSPNRYIRKRSQTIAIVVLSVIGVIVCGGVVYGCRFITEKEEGLPGTLTELSRKEQNHDHSDWRFQNYAESQDLRVEDYGPIWSKENRDVMNDGWENSGIWG